MLRHKSKGKMNRGTITASGTTLSFSFGGNVIATISSTGAITAEGNITGFQAV
jgi:hypothetical protein